MDFRKATELFADPAFDGEPVVVHEPGGGEPPLPPDDDTGEGGDGDDEDPIGDPDPPPGGTTRYVISGVPVMVVAERVQYYGNDGRLITESLTEYTREAVREKYATLADFLRRWTASDRKAAVIDELREQGFCSRSCTKRSGGTSTPSTSSATWSTAGPRSPAGSEPRT